MTSTVAIDRLVYDDLTPIEIPVSIGKKSYTLREASAGAACRYRNFMLSCGKLGPDGKPISLGDMQDAEPLLVSLCLFESNEDGKEIPVSLPAVRSWRHRIVSDLYRKAKEISGLDRPDTEDELVKQIDLLQKQLDELRAGKAESVAKNWQSAMTATSV